jgi:hypothetical protein
MRYNTYMSVKTLANFLGAVLVLLLAFDGLFGSALAAPSTQYSSGIIVNVVRRDDILSGTLTPGNNASTVTQRDDIVPDDQSPTHKKGAANYLNSRGDNMIDKTSPIPEEVTALLNSSLHRRDRPDPNHDDPPDCDIVWEKDTRALVDCKYFWWKSDGYNMLDYWIRIQPTGQAVNSGWCQGIYDNIEGECGLDRHSVYGYQCDDSWNDDEKNVYGGLTYNVHELWWPAGEDNRACTQTAIIRASCNYNRFIWINGGCYKAGVEKRDDIVPQPGAGNKRGDVLPPDGGFGT